MKFIDLFCGTGGIRIGFEQALTTLGIAPECVFSSEIDKYACQSYELNFGINPKIDVREVEEIPPFDFLLAGFPCQSFSYAGKRQGFGDTRGTLFFEVERLLKKYHPEYFLLENVRGLTTHDSGKTFSTIKKRLTDLGYSINYLLLNSSNFGVPQNRVRIYILGSKKGPILSNLKSDTGPTDSHKFRKKIEQNEFFFTKIKHNIVKDILEDNVSSKYICTKTFTTQLQKVIGPDLEKLHGYRLIDTRGGNSIHSWELGIKGECTPQEIDLMNAILSNRRKKIFGTHQDGKALTFEQISTFTTPVELKRLLSDLVKKRYLSLKEGKYNPVSGNMSFEVFKFLDPESISITLTASDTNRLGVVQNGIPRRLTPRECARLQGYPDSYKLLDRRSAVYKQMGNAVSVPVIEAVIKDFISLNHRGIKC